MTAGMDVRFDLQLDTVTALHLGAGEEDAFSDQPLRRDGAGDVVIPGSSIAGALRSTAERLTGRLWGSDACRIVEGRPRRGGPDDQDTSCQCPVCELFGDVGEGDASRVVVRDVALRGDSAPWTRVRDGVGIDRERGGSAEGTLFTTELLPRGTRLGLEVEVRDAEPAERALVARCLGELGAGRTPLGLGRARGWGWLEAAAPGAVRVRNLGDPDHLLRTVTRSDVASWPEPREEGLAELATGFEEHEMAGPARGRVHLRIEFDLELPEGETLLVNDPMASAMLARDAVHLGVTGPDPDARDVVLPGPTVRGVVRAQAERILRTLGAKACSPFEGRSCLDTTSSRGSDRPCVACDLFGSTERASRLSVCLRPPRGTIHLQPFDHVALDRFTGGARAGRKFDAWSVASTPGEKDPLRFPIRLALDPMPFPGRSEAGPTRNGKKEAPPVRQEGVRSEMGLLLLALRDLRDGLAGFGSGWAKGHGRMVPRDPRLVLETGDREFDRGLRKVGEALGLSRDSFELEESVDGRRWFTPLDLELGSGPMDTLVESLHDRIGEERSA